MKSWKIIQLPQRSDKSETRKIDFTNHNVSNYSEKSMLKYLLHSLEKIDHEIDKETKKDKNE